MDATSVFLARKLTERIEEKRQAMMAPLVAGALADYPHYRDQAGFLRALAWVEAAMAEISAADADDPLRKMFEDKKQHA